MSLVRRKFKAKGSADSHSKTRLSYRVERRKIKWKKNFFENKETDRAPIRLKYARQGRSLLHILIIFFCQKHFYNSSIVASRRKNTIWGDKLLWILKIFRRRRGRCENFIMFDVWNYFAVKYSFCSVNTVSLRLFVCFLIRIDHKGENLR